MTPEELMALYAPFLLNFFLIWLTNVSERKTVSHSKEKMNTDKAQTPLWNVSSFLT